jgi:hypothetical protein
MLNLNPEEIKDIEVFCKLNEFTDVNEFVKECFNKGYQIEKYGLLTIDGQTIIEKEVIKEVIKEVPVEVIKKVTEEVEVEVVKEVIVEKPVEVVKEVLKEVPVEVIKEVVVEKEVEKIVEVIKEIPVEKVVVKEVVKEVPVEKVVEKEVYITDDSKIKELVNKIELLENRPPEIIEKEVVKEIEVIKEVEVEVIKEIEKPVEVVKEVIKEVEIIKEVENKDKQNKLQDSIKQLREDIRKKDDIILQLEKNVVELQKVKGPTKGQFMRSSNLNDNLYR